MGVNPYCLDEKTSKKKNKRPGLSLSITPGMQIRMAWGMLLLITLAYFAWMYDQSILRYDTFKATAFDLGNLDQAVWNTLHGRWFQFTNHGSNWYGMPIRLSQHVEPIIIPLSLLYLLHADVHMLLGFQTLALASGSLPVFLLTRRFLPGWPLVAPVIALSYLLAPALIGLNIYDFHPASLATPFFLYAMLALTYRRHGWFILCCVLAAACKEEMPAVVAMLGLLVIWKYKMPRTGMLMFLLGVTAFLLAFLVIEPHFNVGAQHNTFWYRYSALGSSPTDAIFNILLHPWIPFTLFFTIDRFYYLASLLRSAGFLALLAPEWFIPMLPSLAINLLSAEIFQHSGVYQYNAAIIPFVIIASIHGLRRLLYLWYGWRGEFDKQELYREEMSLMVPPRKQQTRILSLPGQTWLSTRAYHFRAYTLTRWHAWKQLPIPARLQKTVTLRSTAISRNFQARMIDLARLTPASKMLLLCSAWIITMTILNYIIMLPLLNIFWADHRSGVREQRIEQLLAMIPPDAPVSASGSINPHLTDRQYVTVFPELTVSTLQPGVTIPVEYVIVDLTNVSPEDKSRSTPFIAYLNGIQHTHQFRTIARADGVILLERRHL
jgi:uncharacterized membrane protein